LNFESVNFVFGDWNFIIYNPQTYEINLLRIDVMFAAAFLPSTQPLSASSLSLGADYILRGVSIKERDNRYDNNQYYDQRLIAYLTTDLSKDVEASIRIQSITPWGLENSTTSLVTRYPKADGTPWVQNAYVRMPNIWQNRITLTIGRQPIQWGDGEILSDDEMGFNAVYGQVKSPLTWLPVDLDVFTAKISETMQADQDTDLSGAQIGFSRRHTRWEIMSLWETNDSRQDYRMGSSSESFSASSLERQIFGIRAKVTLRDAYLRGAYYMQQGTVNRSDPALGSVKLGGSAYSIGLGGKNNTQRWGRFGAALNYSVGEGDSKSTPNKDEAFRPTFASRWSGLERKGYGNYFAATFSDAYSPADPFAVATSSNTGLPIGSSGIQTIHFGVESTPWAQWTFGFDYYLFKASNVESGEKDLGSELDYSISYRYSGLLSFKASMNQFNPGKAFEDSLNPTQQKATASFIEAKLHF
jgi:hypothetical protein